MKRYLFAAAAAAALTLGASAQASSQFTGPYAGAHGGYVFGDSNIKDGVSHSDMSARGFEGGVYAGYGHTFDRFYVGGEVEHNWSSAEGKARAGASQAKMHHVRDGAVTARVGYLLEEDLLVYGKGGYKHALFEVNKENDFRHGYTGGAGVEKFLTENVSVRGEYILSHFPDKSHDGISKTTESAVKVGLSYNF